MPFQNLSGEQALDQWSVPLQRALEASTGLRAIFLNEGSALLAGASAIAQGTIERDPASRKLKLTVEVFDAATHRLIQHANAEDSDPWAAAEALSKALTPKGTALGAQSPATLELWRTVLNAPTVPDLVDNCRKLLEGDPAFSPGYVACSNVVFPPADRKAIAERAYLSHSKLKPEAQSVAGQILFQSGKFAQASEVLSKAAPTLPAAWNQVGYSQAMLGNLEAARKALEDYRKFGGDEANAVDSLGEIYFIAGKYEQAERYFLECAEKFPQTQQGGVAKLKAASVKALRGDRGGAEELAKSMIDSLKKSGRDVRIFEEIWRGIILEQDPQAMKKKIETTVIRVPERE